MKKVLIAFTVVCMVFPITVLSEEITLQQGGDYNGCSDCFICDYSSLTGNNNTDELCAVYEC